MNFFLTFRYIQTLIAYLLIFKYVNAEPQYGRISGSSIVTENNWLVIGGSFQTSSTQTIGNFAAELLEIVNNVIYMPFKDVLGITTREVDPNPTTLQQTNPPNWMNSTGSSCNFQRATGYVYCIGGRHLGFENNTREYISGMGIFDSNTLNWLGTATTVIPDHYGSGSFIMDNKLYVFGGFIRSLNSVDETAPLWQMELPEDRVVNKVYPVNETTTYGGSPQGRIFPCMTPVNTTHVVMLGGFSATNTILRDAWILDVPNMIWTDITTILNINGYVTLSQRIGMSCTASDNTLWLFGGGISIGGSIFLRNDVFKVDMPTLSTSRMITPNTDSSNIFQPQELVPLSEVSINGNDISASSLDVVQENYQRLADNEDQSTLDNVDSNLQIPSSNFQLENLESRLLQYYDTNDEFDAETLEMILKRDISISESSSGPSGRSYAMMAAFEEYILIFGGENTFNTDLNEWEATDPNVYFFNTTGNSWVTDSSQIGTLVPAFFSPPPPQKSSNSLAIILGVVLGVVGLLLIILFIAICLYRRKEKKRHEELEKEVEKEKSTTGLIFDAEKPGMTEENRQLTRYYTPLNGLDAFIEQSKTQIKSHRSLSLSAKHTRVMPLGQRPNSISIGELVSTTYIGDISEPVLDSSIDEIVVIQEQEIENESIAALIDVASIRQKNNRSRLGTVEEHSNNNSQYSRGTSIRDMSPDGFGSPLRQSKRNVEENIINDLTAVFNQNTDSPNIINMNDSKSVKSISIRSKRSIVPSTTTTVALPLVVKNGKGTNVRLFKALWEHEPIQNDELAIKPGDVVEEVRAFADGWSMVINRSQNNVRGMIPKNILKDYTPKSGTDSEPGTNTFNSRAPSQFNAPL